MTLPVKDALEYWRYAAIQSIVYHIVYNCLQSISEIGNTELLKILKIFGDWEMSSYEVGNLQDPRSVVPEGLLLCSSHSTVTVRTAKHSPVYYTAIQARGFGNFFLFDFLCIPFFFAFHSAGVSGMSALHTPNSPVLELSISMELLHLSIKRTL
jgi:hypothetical protein